SGSSGDSGRNHFCKRVPFRANSSSGNSSDAGQGGNSMKRIIIGGLVLLVLAGIIASAWIVPNAKWSGVDESVVEKFAKEAGRPPAEPYLNTDQGDLKLFVFLVAGA